MKRVDEIHGDQALQKAQHMARVGHHDWIYWRDSDGRHAARKTPEAVKAMLLKIGTKGDWCLINANDGTLFKGFWWLGINALNWMKRGEGIQ